VKQARCHLVGAIAPGAWQGTLFVIALATAIVGTPGLRGLAQGAVTGLLALLESPLVRVPLRRPLPALVGIARPQTAR